MNREVLILPWSSVKNRHLYVQSEWICNEALRFILKRLEFRPWHIELPFQTSPALSKSCSQNSIAVGLSISPVQNAFAVTREGLLRTSVE